MTETAFPANQPVAPAAPAQPVAPAAPAAPPAAPAAPATPPATPAEPDPTSPPAGVEVKGTQDPKTGKTVFQPTGDAGLDLALEHFGKAGLTPDSPEIVMAAEGNFQFLEAKIKELAAKGDAAAERYLALAKEAYVRLADGAKAAYESRKKAVHEAVGGSETWDKIVAYVKEHAEPKELEEVKEALAKGGTIAVAMAEKLHRLWSGASGTTIEPKSPVTQQPTVNSNTPLTLTSYKQELNALVAKYGAGRVDSTPEYATLRRKYAGVTK